MTGNQTDTGVRSVWIKWRGLAATVAMVVVPITLVFASAQTTDLIGLLFGRVEKIQAYIVKEKLVAQLALSDAQVDKVMATLKKTNTKRQALFRRRADILDQIEAHSKQAKPVGTLSPLLAELSAIEDDNLEIEKAKRRDLRAHLTPEQEAQFLIWRRNMVEKMFNILKPFL